MIKKRYIKRMYGEVLCCDKCGDEMICADIHNDNFLEDPTYMYKCNKCGEVVALKLEDTPSPFKFEYEDEVSD